MVSIKKNLIKINRLKKWSDWSVRSKLIMAFLVVMLLSIGVGIAGINGMSQITRAQTLVKLAGEAVKLDQDLLIEQDNFIKGDQNATYKVEGLYLKMQNVANEITKIATKDIVPIINNWAQTIDQNRIYFAQIVDLDKKSAQLRDKWKTLGQNFKNVIEEVRSISKPGDEVYLQADKLESTFYLMRVSAVYFIKDVTEATWADFQTSLNNTISEAEKLVSLTPQESYLNDKAKLLYEYINTYGETGLEYKNLQDQLKYNEGVLYKILLMRLGSKDQGNTFYGGISLATHLIEKHAQNTQYLSYAMIISLILIGVVGSILMLIIIVRAITKPVKKMQTGLEKIALGDISEKVEYQSQDEIGQMARSYRSMQSYLQEMTNVAQHVADGDLSIHLTPKSDRDALGNAFHKMIINLSNLIAQIRESASTLANSCQQLAIASQEAGQATQQISQSSQQVARGASDQASSLSQASQAIQQLARAIDQIAQGSQEQARHVEKNVVIVNKVSEVIKVAAANALEANNSSKAAAESAEKGAMMAKQTVIGMEKIKQTMAIASQKINELGNRSKEIGKIISTIDDIADQTNLLALNAAIEAARAGEWGRGFAVVADEVRKLAERSSASTKEIEELISRIQQGVTDTVESIKNGVVEVENGYELATKAGNSLEDILEHAKNVSNQIGVITRVANELTELSIEMVKLTDGISSIVEENTASTEEMAASSKQVQESVEGVAGVAEQNSAASQEVSASSEQISAQVQQVVAATQSLSAMAAELEKAVAIFKTNGHAKENNLKVSAGSSLINHVIEN